MKFNFIKYKRIYYVFSGILLGASIVSLFMYGLKPGIDFTGGSILEADYKDNRPSVQEIRQNISDLNLGDVSVQLTGDKGIILKTKSLDETIHQEILLKLGNVEEKSFESIGPSVGVELKNKTFTVAVVSVLAIALYIIIAFAKVSYPVKSWQYGMATLFMLLHDVLIPLGVFSLLGKFYGIQITIPVIVALLTVVGYAVNNVVVVFDRIRENLLRRTNLSFEETADNSVKQTLTRQINTSLATLLPLVFIYFLGGETLKYFSLALIIGILAGLYSSIFLAGQILTSWLKTSKNK
jgi:preprotein translocase subunit SecF